MKANPNFDYLHEKILEQRVTLLQGGTRSGKTYSTILFLIDYCLLYNGMEIDIVRDTFTALKATAWKDFKDVLTSCNLYHDKHHNKTDHTYTLNGNTISYYGADTPDKIHGRSRDILWINEAHQFPQETIDQLFPRTRHRIICDYNPALGLEHWLDPYIEKYPPLITTYKDNPYLTPAQIEDIESRKNNAYWWQIYGSGERANRQGAIFTNWSVGNFDTSLPYAYGQDYGFTIDPTTLVRVAVDEKQKIIYADELLYSTEPMGLDAIVNANKQLILKPNDLIIADSAEPRLIDDLKKKGLNIQGCEKGQGSVSAGISAMQDYKIIITERSHNLRKELSNYIWNDKKAGIPVDAFNHCFVGDTKIRAKFGDVNIEDVQIGDLVLTSNGYKEVVHKFNNGNKQVNKYLLQFDTFFISLTCTDNHKIKTSNGWKAISQLQTNDVLYLCKSLTEKSISYTMEKTTLAGALKDFMLKFGKNIKVLFQKATMFTTKTAIRTITKFQTLTLSEAICILNLRVKNVLKTIQSLLKTFTLKALKPQKFGTVQMKERNGTQNMESKLGLIESSKHLFVNNAAKNTQQGTQGFQNSAITTARLKHLEIEESSKQMVYDLMIEETHEYFANGVLVHNCIDALRYSFNKLARNTNKIQVPILRR
jgi:phage terminase large subunit